MNRPLWLVTAVAFAAAVGVDLALGVEVLGFTAALGFVGCVLIVVVSKWLGKLIQRRESYYEWDGDG